jgi:formylglycine-generating enzyme required for sulfatase activity
VRIPAGTFQMGCGPADNRCDPDEQPRHAVTLTRGFDLMRTEMTVGMLRALSFPIPDDQPPWSTTEDHPVTVIRWTEASAVCDLLGGRLPTEAEWEYAARGGLEDAVRPWGDDEPTDRRGAPNGAAFESDRPQPVRFFGPNAYGLDAMVGNVWEWVADWYGRYDASAVSDPTGPPSGMARVVRGGSYGDDASALRVSNRSANLPRNRNFNIGFRCARDAR